ncbi:MAG: fumarylacetoacetate hydrolase family protein [Pseudomonadota bacterium]|nr:fumarylacetoacetate hydrolase family protein [Pseudomonadota bacterium]
MSRFLGIALLLVAVALASSLWLSRSPYDSALDPAALREVSIAPPEQALSFARSAGRLLLVLRYAENKVDAVDLTAQFALDHDDPLRTYAALGYDALAGAATAPRISVAVSALELPLLAPAHNLAIGTNYREHAREAGLEEQPFLFPKIAAPTRHDIAVPKGTSARLDYEAELGLVVLEDLDGPTPAPARMGLVLCNELTDRWALVRNFKRGSEMGTSGFVDGKSRDGFSVLGPLLVIPRDLAAFYPQLRLQLWRNGLLRQDGIAADMVWNPAQQLQQFFARADWSFHRGDGTVALLPQPKRITAGTVIFSGTPAGVIFKPHNLWASWLYLQPGEDVAIRADYLGVIRNRILD